MGSRKVLVYKKQYSYISKFYRGVPVVTLLDMEYFTKIPRVHYQACIKKHKNEFLKGIDYWHLKDHTLLEFFYENPQFISHSSRIFIMSSYGLLKLGSIIKTDIY